MKEENNEKWLNYLSITTVLLAVFATLSTFKGGGYSTKSLLSQSKASDQWSHFQAKGIKSYIYEMQKENLELQLGNTSLSASKEDLQKRISTYDEKVKKYNEEKEEISKEAKAFEADRDQCKTHSDRFGIAVIFLQVSILLSSISALAKKKTLWLLSSLVGAVGFIYFVNGFFVFF